MTKKFELPDIPEEEQTPIVKGLSSIVEQLIEHSQKQKEEIDVMKDEIRILKGEKKRPKIKPSKLDESTNEDTPEKPNDDDKADLKTTNIKKRNRRKSVVVKRTCRLTVKNG